MPKLNLTVFQRHEFTWKHCKACSLCESRKKVVLAKGVIPCDILFVGEAPGDSEDVIGRPFVGPAGRLLDHIIGCAFKRIIKIHGNAVPMPELAFTNVVACIPKENGNKVGEPRPDQIEACKPRLLEMIQLSRPTDIVFVGKVAQAWSEEYRKEYWSLTRLKSYPFHLTHPAFILKSPKGVQSWLTQKAIDDMEDIFLLHTGLVPF